MTREEEIAVASAAFGSRGSSLDFTVGAKWADANPKNPWISVEDELPYYHKELIQYYLGKPKTVEVVVKNRFSLSIDYMLLDNERWQWMRNFGVTHWMPIPEPPKK